MKAICWDDEIEFDKLSLYHAPYYVMGFHRKPQISKEPLELTGAILRPDDEIACITGRKTSAGFDMLYPVAPVRFRYIGTHCTMGGDRYALWLPSENGKAHDLPHPDYATIYFGHAIYGDGNLLFTIPSGAGRVIESDEVYFRHDEVPESIRRAAAVSDEPEKEVEMEENGFPEPSCAC